MKGFYREGREDTVKSRIDLLILEDISFYAAQHFSIK